MKLILIIFFSLILIQLFINIYKMNFSRSFKGVAFNTFLCGIIYILVFFIVPLYFLIFNIFFVDYFFYYNKILRYLIFFCNNLQFLIELFFSELKIFFKYIISKKLDHLYVLFNIDEISFLEQEAINADFWFDYYLSMFFENGINIFEETRIWMDIFLIIFLWVLGVFPETKIFETDKFWKSFREKDDEDLGDEISELDKDLILSDEESNDRKSYKMITPQGPIDLKGFKPERRIKLKNNNEFVELLRKKYSSILNKDLNNDYYVETYSSFNEPFYDDDLGLVYKNPFQENEHDENMNPDHDENDILFDSNSGNEKFEQVTNFSRRFHKNDVFVKEKINATNSIDDRKNLKKKEKNLFSILKATKRVDILDKATDDIHYALLIQDAEDDFWYLQGGEQWEEQIEYDFGMFLRYSIVIPFFRIVLFCFPYALVDLLLSRVNPTRSIFTLLKILFYLPVLLYVLIKNFFKY
jgi:hypothetical protein